MKRLKHQTMITLPFLLLCIAIFLVFLGFVLVFIAGAPNSSTLLLIPACMCYVLGLAVGVLASHL